MQSVQIASVYMCKTIPYWTFLPYALRNSLNIALLTLGPSMLICYFQRDFIISHSFEYMIEATVFPFAWAKQLFILSAAHFIP